MKLEDLKRYDLDECAYLTHYGTWYVASDVRALDAAHKQREAELVAEIKELITAVRMIISTDPKNLFTVEILEILKEKEAKYANP